MKNNWRKANSTSTGFLSRFGQRIASTREHSHLKIFSNRTLSLRWYLVLLVAGTLLPVVVFAVVVVHKLSSQEQVASERRMLLAARNLSSIVERELSSTTRTLQALAASEQLSQGNLNAFHSEAKRAAQTQASWMAVILLSPDGQQLVNTKYPFGTPLVSAVEMDSLQRVVRTHQPTVGNLAPGNRQPGVVAFPVRIPVMRDTKLQYVLTAVITQKAIANVMNEQTTVDGEWARTIVDGQGVVVARTRHPERFMGQRGTPSFLKRIRETTEGVYRDTTLEGMKVYVAFCQVSNSSWTVAVTVPIDVIQGPTRQAMWLVAGSGLALLFVSGIGAFILSRQISRSITSAAAAAAALAKGEYPQVSSLSLKEVVLLGQSLEFAAELLWQRERERTENLTRAEAAREEAEAANRVKDEFLTVLSHELRTPLNPILGWSRLLRSGKLDAAKTTYALETIERNAELQTQLIEDLLDVSRIMQGKLSLNSAPVNLISTIESAIETVQLAAEAKSIDLQFTIYDCGLKNKAASQNLTSSSQQPTFQVLGDTTRLQQVIWNLLSNAIKFTAETGRVNIQLEQIGNEERKIENKEKPNHSPLPALHSPTYAQITVSDTGQGIAPDFLPHVFEYFRQEDSTTTRRFDGLGLGLAIVRHLVELHGGTVQADSAGEGQGATFTVRLPLQRRTRAEDEDKHHPIASSSCHVLAGLRVLLVDDDVDTRDFIAFALEQHQAIVTSVSSASEALRAFNQAKFDVLISDIGMPEMDGYGLLQQIRSRSSEPGGQVPAIALTAYAGKYNQQQALKAGFQRHVAKPVEPEALISVIVGLVNSK